MIVTIKFKNKKTLQLVDVWNIETKQHLYANETISIYGVSQNIFVFF